MIKSYYQIGLRKSPSQSSKRSQPRTQFHQHLDVVFERFGYPNRDRRSDKYIEPPECPAPAMPGSISRN